MTVSEIFEKLNSHLVEGVMLHDQLAEYYDFFKLARLQALPRIPRSLRV